MGVNPFKSFCLGLIFFSNIYIYILKLALRCEIVEFNWVKERFGYQ